MDKSYLNKIIKFAIVTAAIVSSSAASLNVITSIPDIADIAKEIGRDSVSVFSLAQGNEDYHMIRARSSFLPKINRANLVVCLGLEAENRWLVPIIEAARNSYVQQGHPGWIEAYRGIEVLEKPLTLQSVNPHIAGHRLGNPHINEGPYSGKIIAKNIYEAFVREEQKNQALYTKNYQEYIKKLDVMEHRLKQKAALLNNVHVISYHADLAYFCHFYGMVITGCLEPQPGIPPNSRHLAKLILDAQRDHVQLVLYHQAQNPQLPEKIAKRIGAREVCFANMVNSRKEIHTFIELQEYNMELMLAAVAGENKR